MIQDLNYLAGIMDADGCFNINKYYPRMIVVNTDKRMVNWLKSKFGGDITKTAVKNKPTWKPRYTWRLQHQKSLDLAEKLQPFLKVKNDQALIFTCWSAIRDVFKQNERRESYDYLKSELHKDNQKGITIEVDRKK